jgi:hypothetical protein
MWPFNRHARDNLRSVADAGYWIGWLGEKPGLAIKREIEIILREQAAGTVVEWLHLHADPYFLTGGHRLVGEDVGKILVTRAGFVVGIECQVANQNRTERLTGAFSWVAIGLNSAQRMDRIWLELNADVSAAAALLKTRIYDLDPATIDVLEEHQ